MKTLEELQAIREQMKAKIGNREVAGGNDIRIVVGMATCGIAAGAREVMNAISKEISDKKLDNVKLTQTGCIGICTYEPIVEVTLPNQEKVTYVKMTAEKVKTVINGHVINGTVVEEYTYNNAIKGGN